VLHENGILGPALSANLEKMAKFSNVFVHQDEGVDTGIVVTILRTHLNDFRLFRDAVLAYLNKA